MADQLYRSTRFFFFLGWKKAANDIARAARRRLIYISQSLWACLAQRIYKAYGTSTATTGSSFGMLNLVLALILVGEAPAERSASDSICSMAAGQREEGRRKKKKISQTLSPRLDLIKKTGAGIKINSFLDH